MALLVAITSQPFALGEFVPAQSATPNRRESLLLLVLEVDVYVQEECCGGKPEI